MLFPRMGLLNIDRVILQYRTSSLLTHKPNLRLQDRIIGGSRCMSSQFNTTTTKVFVAGLAWATDNDSLYKAFTTYGKVCKVRVVRDKDTGRSRGFGFVEFAKVDAASAAIKALDKTTWQVLDKRMIRVQLADEPRHGCGFVGYGVDCIRCGGNTGFKLIKKGNILVRGMDLEDYPLWFQEPIYHSGLKLLFVAESDFGHARSMAWLLGRDGSNITATTLDTYDQFRRKYKNGPANLASLLKMGARVVFEVDIKRLRDDNKINNTSYYCIAFIYPHSEVVGNEFDPLVVSLNRKLLSDFFSQGPHLITAHTGELHVAHKDNTPYRLWGLREAARENGLYVLSKMGFHSNVFPFYQSKMGSGDFPDKTFCVRRSSLFVFGPCKTVLDLTLNEMSPGVVDLFVDSLVEQSYQELKQLDGIVAAFNVSEPPRPVRRSEYVSRMLVPLMCFLHGYRRKPYFAKGIKYELVQVAVIEITRLYYEFVADIVNTEQKIETAPQGLRLVAQWHAGGSSDISALLCMQLFLDIQEYRQILITLGVDATRIPAYCSLWQLVAPKERREELSC